MKARKALEAIAAAAALVATAAITTSAHAQFIKGNEAVQVLPDGTKKVETPPPAKSTRICAADGGCHPGPWHMVETTGGLMECTEPFARPKTCRASSYGAQKISRVWVVRKGTQWLWCQRPDLNSKCVDMNARPPANLPLSAVQ